MLHLALAPLLLLAPPPHAAPPTAGTPTAGTPTAGSPTAESLLARCMEALGGRERIQALRTLRVTWRHAGSQELCVDEWERPRRFNRTIPGRDFRLLFDGTRAALWGEHVPGEDPGCKLMADPEEPKDVDNDIALLFPPIFDHPCTYEGMEEVEGVPTHHLRLTTPSGVEMHVNLDAKTCLPLRLNPRFTRRGETWSNTRLFSDYRPVQGLLYPHAVTGVTPARRYTHQVVAVEINPALPADTFRIPGDAVPQREVPLATQTAVLVERCLQAAGGPRLRSLQGLRVTTRYPDHAAPVVQEFLRPLRLRNTGSGLAFDGLRASRRGRVEPGLSTPENLQHFELDAAFLFPLFLDHPAVYQGRETVEGRRAYRLGLTLPRGARVTYFLDPQTWLPLKIAGESTVQGRPYLAERVLSDYRVVEGVAIPMRFTYAGKAGPAVAMVERVEVNPPLDPGAFSPAADGP